MKASFQNTKPIAAVESASAEVVCSNSQIGRFFLWALLGTIAMLFIALVSAYLVRRSGSDWYVSKLPAIFWWNVLLLIPGSFAMNAAKHNFICGNRVLLQKWLSIAVSLGILFLVGQAYGWSIWSREGIFLSTNPYSSFFYLFSGLHALHIFGGVIWLGMLVFASIGAINLKLTQTALYCVADYWLFLAVVWIGLLGVLTFL